MLHKTLGLAIDIQWNLSIVDTTGPRKCVLIREVFSRFHCII